MIDNKFGKDYNTEVVDDTFDGILWLKLHNKFDNSKVFPCCCYLPRNHFTRQVDAHEFFDTLLSSIYKYQDEGLIFICGDFNSRCSDNADYIVGVDEIPERDVVDYSCN